LAKQLKKSTLRCFKRFKTVPYLSALYRRGGKSHHLPSHCHCSCWPGRFAVRPCSGPLKKEQGTEIEDSKTKHNNLETDMHLYISSRK